MSRYVSKVLKNAILPAVGLTFLLSGCGGESTGVTSSYVTENISRYDATTNRAANLKHGIVILNNIDQCKKLKLEFPYDSDKVIDANIRDLKRRLPSGFSFDWGVVDNSVRGYYYKINGPTLFVDAPSDSEKEHKTFLEDVKNSICKSPSIR